MRLRLCLVHKKFKEKWRERKYKWIAEGKKKMKKNKKIDSK